jgi:Domain of unknown function (DUF4124)
MNYRFFDDESPYSNVRAFSFVQSGVISGGLLDRNFSMSRFLLLILCVLISTTSVAQIYKTVDKDGNVVYSDTPPNDQAESVKLKQILTLPAETPTNSTSTSRDDGVVQYQVEIVSPRNEVVIPPGQRDLAVAIVLNPSLQQDHLITYYIDGELVQETQSTSIVIQDPPRGGRTLTVEVINQQGDVLGVSAPLAVNVIRPIAKKGK